MTNDKQAEREAFEAAYVAHLNQQGIHTRTGMRDYTVEEIVALREDDNYLNGAARTGYLNGCWQGWQLARSQPAAAPAQDPIGYVHSEALADLREGAVICLSPRQGGKHYRVPVYAAPAQAAAPVATQTCTDARRGQCGADGYCDTCPSAPAQPSAWIPWHGGECPVPAETRVEVKLCDEYIRNFGAAGFKWQHRVGDTNIIAYRIVTDKGEAKC